MGEKGDCLFPRRREAYRSSSGQMQLFGELSVDECVGCTGIEHKVEWTGSVDRDGNDDYGFSRHPEFDLPWLLAKAGHGSREIQSKRQKCWKSAGETEGRHVAHLELRTSREYDPRPGTALKSLPNAGFSLLKSLPHYGDAGNKGILPNLWLIALRLAF
jgi:hypothetical protein